MNKCLIVLRNDWADEFECQEFLIVNTIEEAYRIKDRCELSGGYFGTNEGWEEGELSENAISITVIDKKEYEVIEKFLSVNFGVGILWNNADKNT
tara:strand:- start:122 stop:406 length:285 start_codon:yes stop_codon:yes gene_type:complete